MIALTTHQRDLLRALLSAEKAVGFAALGRDMGLTARQVRYSLSTVETWLAQHEVKLVKLPGVGVQLMCHDGQRRALLRDMDGQQRFQLVLTSGQRQQLLALHFLTAPEPSILYQLQHAVEASRTTILKDLDGIDEWLATFGLALERRPHYGCAIEGPEFAQRQALAALLWGNVPFGEPLFAVTYMQGVVFTPARDATLLPMMQQAAEMARLWDLPATLQHVASAEAALDVRFTDDTFFQLALSFAIQTQRVRAGRTTTCAADPLHWLKQQPVWPVAQQLALHLLPSLEAEQQEHESAAVAMQLLAGARDDGWVHDLNSYELFRTLIATLMHTIANAYHMPEMERDRALGAGLEAHVIPACMRQRFGLWSPKPTYQEMAAERYSTEWKVAQQVIAAVHTQIGVLLPDDELGNLVLLLRAARIRERPVHPRSVLVVCPSGMATTQLLVARLKARFPHLGTYQVVSIRDLTPEQIEAAHLIISTVPLALENYHSINVIQVHPLLSPQDVATITQWMS